MKQNRVVDGVHIAAGLDVAASRRMLMAARYEADAARARERISAEILKMQQAFARWEAIGRAQDAMDRGDATAAAYWAGFTS